MNELIRKDILRILTKVNNSIFKKDTSTLINTSNEINHNSSIFQDEDSISLAVVVYAISKLMERNKGKVFSNFPTLFKKAKSHLDRHEFEKYRNTIKEIIKKISDVDHKMKSYVIHIYNQSEIKKGSKIFSNGISLPRVAELLNISQWELKEYIGKTNIPDSFGIDKNLKKRLEYSRGLFRL